MSIFNNWYTRVFTLFVLTSVGTTLSLILNSPIGQVTPIWLPAGLSFVAVWLWGRNLWPGIFFGVLASQLYLDGIASSHITPYFLVALGETLGPLTAAYLVEKLLGNSKRVFSEKALALYLVLAGPLNAIISASVGLSAFYYFDIISPLKISTYALHWIVGQSCGGMIVGGVALMLVKARARNMKKAILLTFPLIVIFLLIFAAFTWVHSVQQKALINYARSRAEVTSSIMDKDLRSFSHTLSLIDAFLSNTEKLPKLQEFISVLDLNRPGILAISLINTKNNTRTEFLTSEHIFADRSVFFKNPEITNLIVDTQSAQKPLAKVIYNYIGIRSSSDSILLISYPTVNGMIIGFFNLGPIVDATMTILSDPSFQIKIYGADYKRTVLADSSFEDSNDFFIPTFIWRKIVSLHNLEIIFEFKRDFSLNASRLITTWIILAGSLILTFSISILYLSLVNKFSIVNQIVKDKTKYLEEANALLKESAREKSAFFAGISHEIRTPLNILLGTNELLSSTALNSEQKNLVATNNKSGNTLLHLINDLLDLSKIEAGKLVINKKPFNLKTEITECIQTFEYQIQEKGLQLELVYDPDLYDSYLGDADRVKQILSNLISNAIKFTDNGKVTVKVLRSDKPKTNIYISVQDSGIGISAENQKKLFKPFMQADDSITRRYGGTGLGLSICKNICEIMGGNIWVQSEAGKGAQFNFTLNLEQTPERIVKKTAEEYSVKIQSQQKLTILVVDDSSDNRMLIKAYLKNTPHEIFEAENGQQAVEMVQQGTFGLVLMDMQMPVMDGYTATRTIREWEKKSGKPAMEIWALTAYAMGHEVEKTRQAGCTLHLSKPIRRKELLKNIAAHGEKRKTDESKV